jgi:hypothetical protein
VKNARRPIVIASWESFVFIVLVLGLIMAGGGCNKKADYKGTASSTAQAISSGVKYWRDHSAGGQLVKWAEEDLNADGRQDAVIIYRLKDGKCKMVAVINLAGRYRLTDPVPAPVFNQQISFKDFDRKPPMETVVTGTNNNYVGIAIFRLEKNQLINLFENDYDKCC